jgi:outer membrane protein assembly factor BamB
MSDKSHTLPLARTVRELDLEEFGNIHGVTVDGDGNLWFGHGKEAQLSCVEPETGRLLRRHPHIRATSGTAYDGSHIWQIAGDRILRVEPETGAIVRSLPTPAGVHCSGMAWVAGALWIGDYSGKRLVKVSLETGEVIKELSSDRFVTGIEWIGGALWHGAWERTGSEGPDVGARLRRLDAESGKVLQEVAVEGNWQISGTGVDAAGRLWCGGGGRGGIRAVRLPG